ncbi:hypothetical protein GGE07_004171 [Sinorhizobium terangae]|nr:hypothetical protein [Sinorhizobium terangae]
MSLDLRSLICAVSATAGTMITKWARKCPRQSGAGARMGLKLTHLQREPMEACMHIPVMTRLWAGSFLV